MIKYATSYWFDFLPIHQWKSVCSTNEEIKQIWTLIDNELTALKASEQICGLIMNKKQYSILLFRSENPVWIWSCVWNVSSPVRWRNKPFTGPSVPPHADDSPVCQLAKSESTNRWKPRFLHWEMRHALQEEIWWEIRIWNQCNVF